MSNQRPLYPFILYSFVQGECLLCAMHYYRAKDTVPKKEAWFSDAFLASRSQFGFQEPDEFRF